MTGQCTSPRQFPPGKFSLGQFLQDNSPQTITNPSNNFPHQKMWNCFEWKLSAGKLSGVKIEQQENWGEKGKFTPGQFQTHQIAFLIRKCGIVPGGNPLWENCLGWKLYKWNCRGGGENRPRGGCPMGIVLVGVVNE